MKKLFALCAIIFSCTLGFSQTDTISNNIYQHSGKLGIGVAIPTHSLQINNNINSGIERNLLRINNVSDEDASYTGILLKTGDGNHQSVIQDYGINYTASTYYDFGGFLNFSNNSKGLMLHANSSDGIIKFFTGHDEIAGAGFERLRIDSLGNIGIGTKEPIVKLDVDGDINLSNGHNYLINGLPINSGDTNWINNSSGIFYDKGVVVVGENYAIPNDSTKFYVRNTSRVMFDAWDFGSGSLELLLQARNNNKAIIHFADGLHDEDYITFDDGKLCIAENMSPVGIGTTNPTAQLDVNGDVKLSGENTGLILKSPDGTEWKITVDNSGELTTSIVTPPTSLKKSGYPELQVNLHPNPSTDIINCEITNANNPSTDTEIYNLSGKMVYMKTHNSSNFSINVSDLENGYYVIKLKDTHGNTIKSEKIIKQ